MWIGHFDYITYRSVEKTMMETINKFPILRHKKPLFGIREIYPNLDEISEILLIPVTLLFFL
jgi:hypothetical protein